MKAGVEFQKAIYMMTVLTCQCHWHTNPKLTI